MIPDIERTFDEVAPWTGLSFDRAKMPADGR
jgi:hypothetical protein